MIRKLKGMGIALVAVLALTAVAASAASAAEFHSSAEHTILSGKQTESHKFTAGAGFGAISCTTATFAGTGATKTATDQTIKPTYAGCKDTLGRTADVTVAAEANYTFTNTTLGTVDLVGGGISINVTNSSGGTACMIAIPAQNGINNITYNNLGGVKGVEVGTESNNITNTTSVGGILGCGVSNGTHTSGTYTGKTVVTGVDTTGAAVELNYK